MMTWMGSGFLTSEDGSPNGQMDIQLCWLSSNLLDAFIWLRNLSNRVLLLNYYYFLNFFLINFLDSVPYFVS